MPASVPIGLFVVSLLMIVLAVPLILRKIPKNSIYGFRTHKSLTGTDQNWYHQNHIAGVALCIAGVVSLAACILIPMVPALRNMAASICTGVLVATVIGSTAYAFSQQGK